MDKVSGLGFTCVRALWCCSASPCSSFNCAIICAASVSRLLSRCFNLPTRLRCVPTFAPSSHSKCCLWSGHSPTVPTSPSPDFTPISHQFHTDFTPNFTVFTREFTDITHDFTQPIVGVVCGASQPGVRRGLERWRSVMADKTDLHRILPSEYYMHRILPSEYYMHRI
jgi:hypothetical protein